MDAKTLQDAIQYFSNHDRYLKFLVSLRWPNGVICPTCGVDTPSFLATPRVWQCRKVHPKRKFSIKVGTIFEDSALGLDKWLIAMWMIANCKNGISSYEISRAIGITQKSAWFVLHRIRLAMKSGTLKKVRGEVEVDETFIGGKARNMHAEPRRRKVKGLTGMEDKVAVLGILKRGGPVRALVVENRKKPILQAEIKRHVEMGAAVYTDALRSYQGLSSEYAHYVIDHALEYVNGSIHTNGLENFWSLLKRGLKGTYISVEPFHLFRYLDEQVFRFNHRKDQHDGIRFRPVVSQILGKRLTYFGVTGKHLSSETCTN